MGTMMYVVGFGGDDEVLDRGGEPGSDPPNCDWNEACRKVVRLLLLLGVLRVSS